MNPRPARLLAAALAAVLLAPAAAFAAQPSGAGPAAPARPAGGAKPGAPAAGMRARPVHIEIDAPLPRDLPSDLMLGNNDGGGYAVTYLVRGKGISGVDKDSLRISSATVGGADISKDERGRDAWSFGPFPRIADDGSAATFEIRVRPGAGHIKSGVPVLHGSIGVECATGREAKTATLLTKPGSTAQLGPLKLTVPADEDEDGGGGANAGAAFAEMIAQQAGAAGEDGGDDDGGNAEMAAALLAGMFGGGGGSGFELEVSGDGSALATLVLVVDGEEIEPRSWMNFGRGTTYGFPAVKGGTVRVKAEFWTGRRTETVSF